MAEMERLEARLTDLAGAVHWPPTPDLRTAVRARTRRRRRRRAALLLLAAALALALAAGAAAAAYVGLRGLSLERVERPPPASPRPSGDAGVRLALGLRYGSLDEVAQVAGFRPLLPASLGTPDEVYFRSNPDVVTLLYRPRPGLPASSDPEVGALVMESRASLDEQAFGKLTGPGTRIERVTVNGGTGYWISGAEHGFFIYGRDPARNRMDELRLAGDVLVWNQAGLVVRIESGLRRQEALATAGSVR